MTDEPAMKDSGERRTFSTGAVRDRGGFKPRPDLISPHANLREGAWLAKGAEKYGARNYEKGIPISECVASLNRHLEAYKLGLEDEDHITAIRTNAGFIIHFEEEIKAGRMDSAIDDMPKYVQRDILDGGGPVYAVDWPSLQLQWSDGENMSVEAQEALTAGLADAKAGRVSAGPDLEAGKKLVDSIEEDEVPCEFCRICGAHIPPRIGEGTCVQCDPAGATAHLKKYTRPLTMEETNALLALTKQRQKGEDTKSWAERVVAETPEAPNRTELLDTLQNAADREQDEYEAQPMAYIAGPMRGIPDFNFPLFDEAAEFCTSEKNWRVVSPAQLDRAAGIDPGTFKETPDAVKRIIERDLKVILQLDPVHDDGMVLLPGWSLSTGARAEVALALWLGVKNFCTYIPVDYKHGQGLRLSQWTLPQLRQALFCQRREVVE